MLPPCTADGDMYLIHEAVLVSVLFVAWNMWLSAAK